ncbi:MAG TPA: hypothetical protein VGW40_13295 [Allosphingosinicella sp.]|nr:hypothetical protein [Allosphingosinicella sp.]
MEVRHLIAYALIVLFALVALVGGTILARRRSEARRIRRGGRPR